MCSEVQTRNANGVLASWSGPEEEDGHLKGISLCSAFHLDMAF